LLLLSKNISGAIQLESQRQHTKRQLLLSGVAVEKLFFAKFAKMKLREEAL
jgi:hypothetical protein